MNDDVSAVRCAARARPTRDSPPAESGACCYHWCGGSAGASRAPSRAGWLAKRVEVNYFRKYEYFPAPYHTPGSASAPSPPRAVSPSSHVHALHLHVLLVALVTPPLLLLLLLPPPIVSRRARDSSPSRAFHLIFRPEEHPVRRRRRRRHRGYRRARSRARDASDRRETRTTVPTVCPPPPWPPPPCPPPRPPYSRLLPTVSAARPRRLSRRRRRRPYRPPSPPPPAPHPHAPSEVRARDARVCSRAFPRGSPPRAPRRRRRR